MGDVIHSGPLAAGEQAAGQLQVTLDRNLAGTFYLFLMADATYNVWERVENEGVTNRVMVPITIGPPPRPDLALAEVTAPATAIEGETIEIQWEATNLGEASAAASWWDRVYLSADSELDLTGDNPDLLLGQFRHAAPLPVGAASPVSIQAQLPARLPGNWQLIISGDDADEIWEVDEGNNLVVRGLEVQYEPAADLVVAQVGVSPLVSMPEETVTVEWTVANQGPVAVTSNWSSRIELVQGAARHYLTQFVHPAPLSVGGQVTSSLAIRLPQELVDGDYQVVVTTDTFDRVYEAAGEGNNATAASLPFDDPTRRFASGPPLGAELRRVGRHRHGRLADPEPGDDGDKPQLGRSGVSVLRRSAGPSGPPRSAGAGRRRGRATECRFAPGQVRRVSAAGHRRCDGTILGGAGQRRGGQSGVPSDRDHAERVGRPAGHRSRCSAGRPARSDDPGPADGDESGRRSGGRSVDRWDPTIRSERKRTGWTLTNLSRPWRSAAAQIRSAPLKLPLAGDGDYVLTAVADIHNWLYEGPHEDNNTHSLLLRMRHVDLLPSFLSAASQATSGDMLPLVWQIENQGTAATIAPWTDRIYLSTDSVYQCQRSVAGREDAHRRTMAPGASVTATADVTLPLETAGPRYLLLVTDATDAIEELTAGNANNVVTSPLDVTLIPHAELAVDGRRRADVSHRGSRPDYRQLVSPQPGRRRRRARAIGTKSSKRRAIDSGSPGVSANWPGLRDDRAPAAGETVQSAENVLLAAGIPGPLPTPRPHRCRQRHLRERRRGEQYRVGAGPFDVTPIPYADMVVDSIQVAPPAASGQPLAVAWTIRNQGIGPTNGDRWYDSCIFRRIRTGARRALLGDLFPFRFRRGRRQLYAIRDGDAARGHHRNLLCRRRRRRIGRPHQGTIRVPIHDQQSPHLRAFSRSS